MCECDAFGLLLLLCVWFGEFGRVTHEKCNLFPSLRRKMWEKTREAWKPTSRSSASVWSEYSFHLHVSVALRALCVWCVEWMSISFRVVFDILCLGLSPLHRISQSFQVFVSFFFSFLLSFNFICPLQARWAQRRWQFLIYFSSTVIRFENFYRTSKYWIMSTKQNYKFRDGVEVKLAAFVFWWHRRAAQWKYVQTPVIRQRTRGRRASNLLK